MSDSTRHGARECWRSLLQAEDETTAARLVVQMAQERLRCNAVAVALRDNRGHFAVRASAGFSPEQDRILHHCALTPAYLARVCTGAETAGAIAYTTGSHVPWGLGPLLLVHLSDARGEDIGLILAANLARPGLPPASARTVLELFSQAVSAALLSLQQRRTDEARVRTIETQKRQLEALLQASAQVHGPNLDEVLQRIAVSMTTDGGFQRAAVYLRRQDDTLCARAFVGVPPEDEERLREPLPFGVFAHLMRPEMQVSRSFVFDHRKHELPPELLESLSIPEDRPCGPDEWHPLDSVTIPLQDRDGRTIGVISLDEPRDGRFPDLSKIQVLELFAGACSVAVEQARLYDEIQRLAMTDALTGLPNRRSFDDALRRELARNRDGESPCSILFCDLDGLKQLNDTFGHEIGDRVLHEVAQHLHARLRAGDFAARLGGDEFVALLPDTSPEQAAVVAQDLRVRVATLEPTFLPPDIRLSISIGVAGTWGTPQLSPAELLRAADSALYTAKTAGRNRVHAA